MITIKGYRSVFFDVDNTLVMWPKGCDPFTKWHERAIEIGGYYLVPHVHHVNLIKNLKEASDFAIIVWSQGGFVWAEMVVKALGLEAYVDACVDKPFRYYDDLPCEQFMGERSYILE